MNALQKVKNKMGCRGYKCIGCLLSWLDGWLEAAPHASITRDSIVNHITSQGKDQNSKCEVLFLLMCIAFAPLQKKKKIESSQCKLEISVQF